MSLSRYTIIFRNNMEQEKSKSCKRYVVSANYKTRVRLGAKRSEHIAGKRSEHKAKMTGFDIRSSF